MVSVSLTTFLTLTILYNLFLSVSLDCSGGVDRCEWVPWRAWSDCSRSCAGGTRKRDRQFCCKSDLAHSSRLCMADCNMDYDYHRQFFRDSESCNTYCYNGGTYRNGYCSCTNRYKGQCCGDVVTCGQPSSISNGYFSTNDNSYTYNAKVTYKCNSGYGLKGNYQRTCTTNGYWTGSSPTCLYAVSCNSGPCKNGATCSNLLGGYKCTCTKGWVGKNCDVDIQPPVVMGCPQDRVIITENMTSLQTWDEPVFEDPHGTSVHVTKNYPTNAYKFPWGEFYILFAAVKPSNGFRTECKFKISVKPHPCKDMEPPANGIVVCNNWRTDFTRACIFACKADYTLPPGYKPEHFYICGATGNWLPSAPVKKCYSKSCTGNVNRCEWIPWRAWSDCSSSCAGGTRNRDRSFCCKAELAHSSRLCMADCNMDYDYQRQFYHDSESCNTHCYNGGTYKYGYCYCTNRYKGRCCGDVVTCGKPSSISNGYFSTNDNSYTYNARVTYKCNSGYGLKGNYQRTCTTNGYWTGSSPTCLYAVSCNSSPCKNGATCINLLGGYRCTCRKGWTGNNCDVDIQPPVVKGCPEDRMIITENMTSPQSWDEPVFEDPHGTSVHVTKNYPTNSHEFPWGEFYIQFTAVKPSNGYRTECKFKISVKPHPCKDLEPPANGIVVCNNWRTDYTKACIFACKADYTLPIGTKPDHFYICGATGSWFPFTPVGKCYSKKVFPSNNIFTFSNCTEQGDMDSIGKFYIDLLKESGFNSLCENYPNDCKSENVSIKC